MLKSNSTLVAITTETNRPPCATKLPMSCVRVLSAAVGLEGKDSSHRLCSRPSPKKCSVGYHQDAHTAARGFDPCIGASRWRASTLRPRGHLIALRRNPTRLRRPLSAPRREPPRPCMLTTGMLRSASASHARWSEQPEQPTAILRTFICPLVGVAEHMVHRR
jgi:hypothetical protein